MRIQSAVVDTAFLVSRLVSTPVEKAIRFFCCSKLSKTKTKTKTRRTSLFIRLKKLDRDSFSVHPERFKTRAAHFPK